MSMLSSEPDGDEEEDGGGKGWNIVDEGLEEWKEMEGVGTCESYSGCGTWGEEDEKGAENVWDDGEEMSGSESSKVEDRENDKGSRDGEGCAFVEGGSEKGKEGEEKEGGICLAMNCRG